MSKSLAGLTLALALALACAGSGAHAESWQVPQPYMIPLPPTVEPSFELGLRYWASEGKTTFNFSSNAVNSALGSPTSKLSYDGMNGNSGELVWRGQNEAKTFAKGFIGGGGLNGGTLDDEDYLAGQVKFSDTTSNVDGDSLIYGTIDLGQRFDLIDAATKFSIGPFVGFNFYQETASAFGARCNRDDIDGALCGSPGSIAVPFSTEVIKNEANWASLRLGGEARLKLWDRVTLITDVALLPVAYLWNNDSHLLRDDLGSRPNIESKGTGWGYQIEAEARYDFGAKWSAGAGFRYWYAEVSDGKTDFVNLGAKVDLSKFSSERLGVFGDVAYRF